MAFVYMAVYLSIWWRFSSAQLNKPAGWFSSLQTVLGVYSYFQSVSQIVRKFKRDQMMYWADTDTAEDAVSMSALKSCLNFKYFFSVEDDLGSRSLKYAKEIWYTVGFFFYIADLFGLKLNITEAVVALSDN